jgi:pimeloyl-ACP methyl ester carboxylesterase
MFGAPLVEMAKSARVIAVHLQGHGRTKDIDRPLAYESLADDVALLLEKLGVERASVMGYSLGAGVAIQMAVRHPAVVERLIVVSIPFSSAGFFPDVQAAFAAMPANAAMIAGTVSQSPLGALYPDVEWESLFRKIGEMNMVGRDWSAEIAGIMAPTLLIFADADAVPPHHVAEFYGLLGGGRRDGGLDGSGRVVHRLAIIPGTTHYDILQSSAVTRYATDFLLR